MKKQSIYVGVIIIIIIIGLLLGIILLIQSPVPKEEVKFGLLLPLTGNESNLGENINNGMKIAVEEYNSLPNPKQVTVITEDSASDPKTALNAMIKLITLDNIDYSYAGVSKIASAVSASVLENKVPTFTSAVSKKVSADNLYMYNFYCYAPDFAKLIAQDLNKKDINSVTLLIFNTDTGTQFINEFTKEYKGKINSTELVGLTQVDYRTEILKAKANKSEGIIFIHSALQNIAILNQLVEQDEIVPTYLMLADYGNVNAGAKDALKKIEPYSTWFMLSADRYEVFVNKYKIEFGKSPDATAAYAYNAMKIMLEIVDECGKDKICFNNKVMNTEFTGGVVKDNITFDENRNAIIDSSLIKYDGNKEGWIKIK